MEFPSKGAKNSVISASAVFGLALFSAPLCGQEQKQLSVTPIGGLQAATVKANQIERGSHYPSVIHLTGGVEIKTPVCLPTGAQGKLICDGYMILRADEASYHEDSGRIDARGSVSVIPLLHEK